VLKSYWNEAYLKIFIIHVIYYYGIILLLLQYYLFVMILRSLDTKY